MSKSECNNILTSDYMIEQDIIVKILVTTLIKELSVKWFYGEIF